ncbi:MAG: ATP-binding protein [Spirochaetales bacterium]|nr:ATP-binding protein [Spirochaetales bacterium]
MNEKKFLIYLLVIMFVMFSILSVMIVESHIQRTQVTLLMEYAKILGRMYPMYRTGDLEEYEIGEQIPGFGFYNYYGDPLFQYGTAEPSISTPGNIPFFNSERKSIIVQRDLMNPFVPVLGGQEALDDYNAEYKERIDSRSPEFRKQMVRYVYMEIKDPRIYSMIKKFRMLQFVSPVALIALLAFIWHIYTRNMAYRKQIIDQERLVVLGTAARTLTHEIKNPLSSIRLQSTIIKRSGCSLHDESLRILNEEVDRLSLLTERVGDFLRHPEGEPGLVDLGAEVQKVVERYHLNMNYSRKEEHFPVWIDTDRLRSILENLLNNALQSGSELSGISLDIEKRHGRVLLQIKDRGTGIPEENMEKLYDPFFTTKSTGTGIGLSVVHSFVTAADGELTIESLPGQGTTVTAEFPLKGDLT